MSWIIAALIIAVIITNVITFKVADALSKRIESAHKRVGCANARIDIVRSDVELAHKRVRGLTDHVREDLQ